MNASRESRRRRRGLVSRFTAFAFRKRERPSLCEIRRLEEKQRGLRAATQEWITLLREMEQHGQSDDPTYERYYEAYLKSREQQERLDLALFNLRQDLAG